MTFLQRLRNLWKLSAWEPSTKQIEELHDVGRQFTSLTQEPRMAHIIKRKSQEDIINEVLNEQ